MLAIVAGNELKNLNKSPGVNEGVSSVHKGNDQRADLALLGTCLLAGFLHTHCPLPFESLPHCLCGLFARTPYLREGDHGGGVAPEPLGPQLAVEGVADLQTESSRARGLSLPSPSWPAFPAVPDRPPLSLV